MNVALLNEGTAIERDTVLLKLLERGIETRPVFYPLHKIPAYARAESFPVAEQVAARGIVLPSHAGLTTEDVKATVCKRLRECLN